ncbi:DUF721 domain-containing protein [Candidatus Parcubacteria bacterium]|nr:DUF721 domain-containing protein [Candidatus Parcubacteria bacterium]
MLESTGDYLKQRAARLGLGRGDALAAAQTLLDGLYAHQTRAISLNQQTLKIVTPNAAVASELRLRQVELIGRLNRQATAENCVTKLHIQIRSL